MSEPSYPTEIPLWPMSLPRLLAPGVLLLVLAMLASQGRLGPTTLTVLVGMMIVAALWVAASAVGRDVLTSDAIERRTLFGTRRLERRDLVGLRRQRGRGGSTYYLVPREGRPIRLPYWDGAYRAWAGELPDADVVANQRVTQALEADLRMGATPDARRARVKAVRMAAAAVYAVEILLVAGIFLGGGRAAALAAGILPFAAAVVVAAARLLPARGELVAQEGALNTGGLMPVMPLFAIAGAGLMAGVMRGHVQAFGLIAWGFVAGVALFGLALWLDGAGLVRRTRFGWAVWSFLFLLVGVGMIGQADMALDQGHTGHDRTTVISKHVEHGRRGATHHKLELAPWGAHTVAYEEEVERDLYNAAQPGTRLCVTEHAGALSIPWYELAACG